MDVSFRRLGDDDLEVLHGWLNEPGVVRWWEGDDVSWEAVVRDYGSASTDPTEHWIASVQGRDVGYIQCYAAADYADEDEVRQWWALGVDRTAGSWLLTVEVTEPGDTVGAEHVGVAAARHGLPAYPFAVRRGVVRLDRLRCLCPRRLGRDRRPRAPAQPLVIDVRRACRKRRSAALDVRLAAVVYASAASRNRPSRSSNAAWVAWNRW